MLLISTTIITVILSIAQIYNVLPWYYLLLFAIISFAILAIYAYLIKKPSLEKVALQARIKAFKSYLNMSEEERDQILDAPRRTIEHYERLLPFAISLKAEKSWNNQFANLLEESSYYDHESRHYLLADYYFHQQFGNRFIQSSSAPSSSSGSGSFGGGFSGGGGGGGGVGGW